MVRLAGDVADVVGLVEPAEHACSGGVPGEHRERVQIRHRGVLGSVDAAPEQDAVAGALQVGSRGAVLLDPVVATRWRWRAGMTLPSTRPVIVTAW